MRVMTQEYRNFIYEVTRDNRSLSLDTMLVKSKEIYTSRGGMSRKRNLEDNLK